MLKRHIIVDGDCAITQHSISNVSKKNKNKNQTEFIVNVTKYNNSIMYPCFVVFILFKIIDEGGKI